MRSHLQRFGNWLFNTDGFWSRFTRESIILTLAGVGLWFVFTYFGVARHSIRPQHPHSIATAPIPFPPSYTCPTLFSLQYACFVEMKQAYYSDSVVARHSEDMRIAVSASAQLATTLMQIAISFLTIFAPVSLFFAEKDRLQSHQYARAWIYRLIFIGCISLVLSIIAGGKGIQAYSRPVIRESFLALRTNSWDAYSAHHWFNLQSWYGIIGVLLFMGSVGIYILIPKKPSTKAKESPPDDSAKGQSSDVIALRIHVIKAQTEIANAQKEITELKQALNEIEGKININQEFRANEKEVQAPQPDEDITSKPR